MLERVDVIRLSQRFKTYIKCFVVIAVLENTNIRVIMDPVFNQLNVDFSG